LNRASHSVRSGLTIREERPASYLEALAALFRSLTEAEVSRPAEKEIWLAKSALADFDLPKKRN